MEEVQVVDVLGFDVGDMVGEVGEVGEWGR